MSGTGTYGEAPPAYEPPQTKTTAGATDNDGVAGARALTQSAVEEQEGGAVKENGNSAGGT